MFLPEKGYKRTVIVIFYIIIIYLFVKYISDGLFFWLFPFVLAWLAAYCVQKPIELMYRSYKIPPKLSAGFYVILITALPVSLGFLCISKLVSVSASLYVWLTENFDMFAGSVKNVLDSVREFLYKLPFSEDSAFSAQLSDSFFNFITTYAGKLISYLPTAAGVVIGILPKILIFTAVFCISAFYLSCDFRKCNSFILGIIPCEARTYFKDFAKELLYVTRCYLKSYSMLFLISLTELFFGMLIVGIPRPFTVAFGIAFVDLLPVFGCGTVLAPWFVIEFIRGSTQTGIGLLILYIIITVVRQMIEPKIVGEFTGLHPLLMLMSIFLGLFLFGAFGMFAVPMCVAAAVSLEKRHGRMTDAG